MPRKQAGPVRAKLRAASLGGKLVWILTGVGLVGAVALTVLLALVIVPNFNRLERDQLSGHVARTQAVLGEYAQKVENSVKDYGDWNSSYDYMAVQTKAFEEESFSTLAMGNLGVEGMAYIRPDKSIVIARWIDGETDKPAMRAQLIAAIGRLDLGKAIRAGKSGNSVSFYLRLGNSLAAVGVAQVRKSDGSGEPRGYVLMARTIGSAKLGDLLKLPARLDLTNPAGDVTTVQQATTTSIGVPVFGADGKAVATAAFTVPRDLSLLGKQMLLFAVLGSSLLLAVVLLVLRRMVTRLVLRPLSRVESHMGVVSQSGALNLLTDAPRNDEIGSLVTSFNVMLKQLKDLREQLEAQSFSLGRSESAVAVMHNVRNALNPISTVLSQGLNRTVAIDIVTLDRAFAELIKGDVPEVRRQKLVAYVAAAAHAVEQERDERKAQLAIGREALHHVLEIIGQQQEVAHERPPLDTCDLSDLVAQNATIARYSGGSSVAFSFPSRPHMAMANRVILSQVIGNLFSNAVEAIDATGRGGGSITVTVHERDGLVELVIRDDGEGFDAANAPTLFQRGFSTREHKSGGLGLHWCANSMLAMEGKLELQSEGKGFGARAVITLKAGEVISPAVAA